MFPTRAARFSSSLLRLATSTNQTASVIPRLRASTDLTGIEVESDPLKKLDQTYTKTLEILKTLPESTVYRQAAEALTKHRLEIVRSALKENVEDSEKLEQLISTTEAKIDDGLIEEVLLQAKREENLAAKMLDWKPWEPLEHPAPPGQWHYFSMAEEAGEGGEK
ncbi:hypothetical protein IE53DRAFT_312276 [Violaceomyces palustris]|uniref:Uncharacterized protein n=1 Tax=Violaceomyces palustris TaxID=1673888 RepID=A0ACD0P2H4_9BASI|nr:hypothetical protein IE53DRAFT_312276 [Violaceomyces palustris]